MKEKLRQIRHVALDMDGTIYQGSTLFEFTKPFLVSLAEMGIGHTFLTNNPSKSVKDYLAKLAQMGIEVDEPQLYTSTQSTIEFLQQNYPPARRIFALGTPSMCEEFEKFGFKICEDSPGDEPDAVVIAFDMTLTFSRLCRAAWWIRQGKPFIATNPDRVCPTDQPTVWVDCGSLCACLQAATGRAPDARFWASRIRACCAEFWRAIRSNRTNSQWSEIALTPTWRWRIPQARLACSCSREKLRWKKRKNIYRRRI